jgi:hypothetical protein
MTVRLQAALAAKPHVWGGWVVGPTIIGPEEFARAGYDYVGFDLQHGYLDDADVALLLRRLEHVPIATAVRLPSPAPAPIGRVLDAGADAVIVAMIESAEAAAAAVAATRYAPTGVRSFGPLRADIGLDPAEHETRASVFAMMRPHEDSPHWTRSAPYPDWPACMSGLPTSRSRWERTRSRRCPLQRCSMPWRASVPSQRMRGWFPASTPMRVSPERPWPKWAFG